MVVEAPLPQVFLVTTGPSQVIAPGFPSSHETDNTGSFTRAEQEMSMIWHQAEAKDLDSSLVRELAEFLYTEVTEIEIFEHG